MLPARCSLARDRLTRLSIFSVDRNLNPKAACLKRREEEQVDDDLPEKRLVTNELDKPYDPTGMSPGGGPMRGRARRGRRSSRGMVLAYLSLVLSPSIPCTIPFYPFATLSLLYARVKRHN